MNIGVALPSFASDAWRPPVTDFMALAQSAEAAEFSGLWVADHLLEPPSYNTSWLDPIVTLAAVARETETIPLGTSILVLPLRNPVMTANRVASLQYLSGQRLTLGIGMGYFEDEFAAANVSYQNRSPRFTEASELLYRLLNEPEVSYDGRFYTVDHVDIQPDIRAPPILMAGGGKNRDGDRVVPAGVRRRVVQTDGWIAGPWAPATTKADWKQIAAEATANDQDPEDLSRVLITYTHLVPDANTDEARATQRARITEFVGESGWRFADRNYLLGSISDIRQGLREYAAIGIEEVILGMVVSDTDAANEQLTLWQEHLLDVGR